MLGMNDQKTRVLIIGGGFGGVKAALELAKCENCEVTLVSDHGNFRYYPKLYKAATGGKMDGAQMSLEGLLSGSKVRFVQAQATRLDREAKQVEMADGQKLPYDKLILALGNVTNYFGIEGLAEHSFGIKSAEEVDRFKKHLHQQFIDNGCPDLNYVIVGAGPTGIELAGALPGYIRRIMKEHGAKDCPLQIHLVEALPQLLPRSPKKVADSIAKRLEKLGITLHVNTSVKGATAESLKLGDQDMPSHTVVWTAGVTINPFFAENNFKLTERKKVEVNEFLETEPGIYVLGDNANTQYSGMAQTALHDAHFVAHNIIHELKGGKPKAYVPKRPISVIPVGPSWAVVEWGKFHFGGLIGDLLRTGADLIGFHDLQGWLKAGKHWTRSMGEEKMNCPDCGKAPTVPTSTPQA
jgi:NADH:ubiquinone reductase (H+-translocating)